MDIAIERGTPEFKAAFGAYTHLTVFNSFMNSRQGKVSMVKHSQQMTFADFVKAVQSNQVINQEYARALPDFEIRQSQIDMRTNGHYDYQKARLDLVAKAYQIGIIGDDGVLLPSFIANA